MFNRKTENKIEAPVDHDPPMTADKIAARLVELRADLERANRQRETVKSSGVRDYSAINRLEDIEAWIKRIESELAALVAAQNKDGVR